MKQYAYAKGGHRKNTSGRNVDVHPSPAAENAGSRYKKNKSTIESGWMIFPQGNSKVDIPFTVIIPTYNDAGYILRALESAICQSAEGVIEIIIVDDGSRDNTYEIVENYIRKMKKDPYRVVTLIRNNGHYGEAYCCNLAVRQAKGDYVAFLSPRDWWKPRKLDIQHEYLTKKCDIITQTVKEAEILGKKIEAKYPVMCVSASEMAADDGKLTGHIKAVPSVITYKMILKSNDILFSSVLVKKQAAAQCLMVKGRLNPYYVNWIKIISKYGPAIGVESPLVAVQPACARRRDNVISRIVKLYNGYRHLNIDPVTSAVRSVGGAFANVENHC